MKKVIYIALILIWMSVIFMFSNQKAIDSTKVSNGVINNTIIRIYRLIDKDKPNEEIINKYSHPVRKLAHFTIYLILGLLVLNLMSEYNLTKRDIIYTSILICIIYACLDEVHQAFILGRSCELKDVIIDSIGSFIGIKIISKIKRI